MHYSPQDLKLVLLKDVPAGSLVALVGRTDDIPLVLRLADESNTARVMLLGGQHSFEIAEWSVVDALAQVVCGAKDIRFKLNDPDTQARYSDAGMLTLHNGGAFIAAKPRQNSFHGVQISLGSWQNTDRSMLHGELVTYPNWEVGKVDHRGEFNALLQRKKSA